MDSLALQGVVGYVGATLPLPYLASPSIWCVQLLLEALLLLLKPLAPGPHPPSLVN